MKKRVKRVLSVLLCSITLSLSVISVAVAGNCTHPISESSYSYTEYKSAGSDNHGVYEVKVERCTNCGITTKIESTLKKTESHSMVTVADLGHVGSLSHKYRVQCTKCGETSEKTVPCGGH